jgi:hypothetical protein
VAVASSSRKPVDAAVVLARQRRWRPCVDGAAEPQELTHARALFCPDNTRGILLYINNEFVSAKGEIDR